ncbi:MAG: hypothetical protein V1898_03450 [Patescibacteria group bacterium]
MKNIKRSILKTLAYFDIFEYPLTLLEIHKWLIDFPEKISLSDLHTALTKISEVTKKDGLYFLTGRESCIETRAKRYLITENKFNSRGFILRLLAMMPHVKMIAVCNSLAYGNARDASDIDLFIITDNQYSWTTRFFVTGLVSLLKLRPTKLKTKNTICLSFFISEDNLNLESLQCLDNDIYLKFWITQLMPIYDEGAYMEKFIGQNTWVKKTLSNWQPMILSDRRKIKLSFLERWLKKLLELFSFDKLYKKIQLRTLSPELKKIMNKDTRVIINDSMLKLYPLDRRELYYNEWKNKCDNLT